MQEDHLNLGFRIQGYQFVGESNDAWGFMRREPESSLRQCGFHPDTVDEDTVRKQSTETTLINHLSLGHESCPIPPEEFPDTPSFRYEVKGCVGCSECEDRLECLTQADKQCVLVKGKCEACGEEINIYVSLF